MQDELEINPLIHRTDEIVAVRYYEIALSNYTRLAGENKGEKMK
jgi:hypothetical protein